MCLLCARGNHLPREAEQNPFEPALGHRYNPNLPSSLANANRLADGVEGVFQSSVSAFKPSGGRVYSMSARHGLRGPDQNRDLASQNGVLWRPSEIIAHLLLTFYTKAPIFLQVVYRRGIWHPIKPSCCKAHCT